MAVAPLLPPSLRALLPPDLERRLPQDEIPELGPLLQIRLGAGRPVELCFPGVSRFLAPSGRLVPEASQAWVPDGNLAHQLLQRAAQGSLYALEQELQHGFLTLPGGHRLGLAGQVIAHDGGYRLVHVGSVNVRLARAQPGAGLFPLGGAGRPAPPPALSLPPPRRAARLRQDHPLAGPDPSGQ